jgi:hypothetical protein
MAPNGAVSMATPAPPSPRAAVQQAEDELDEVGQDSAAPLQ